MNEVEEKIQPSHVYDTPTGIVQKEGLLFRGMAKHDPKRPLWVRMLTIFFSILLFIVPGAGLMIICVMTLPLADGIGTTSGVLFEFIFGLLWFSGGVIAIYQNVRK